MDIDLDTITQRLMQDHNYSEGSIALLKDKGFHKPKNLPFYQRMLELEQIPDQTFKERRDSRSWVDVMLDKGDAVDITSGRYLRLIPNFPDISSEQALVRERMRFSVEYIIRLADLLIGKGVDTPLVSRAFTSGEKASLRSIPDGFRTKDYLAAKTIERLTKHDIVAANAWVTIRGQQLGIDEDLMRGLTHFARTSADVNTNAFNNLFMKGFGQWTAALGDLMGLLYEKADDFAPNTVVAMTHGQEAQLTSAGLIYANLGKQISLHADPLLWSNIFRLEGKIAGAVGTEVDWKSAFPNIDPGDMYEEIVEDVFGLEYRELGHDQDCTNAGLARAFDIITNVGLVLQKACSDVWIYASRHVMSKKPEEEESGSSAMPQKANPFLSEGAEFALEAAAACLAEVKKSIVKYRLQGDLKRSMAKREMFHGLMLSTIAIKRLTSEVAKYDPNPVAMELGVLEYGPRIVSSAVQTYLRSQGVPDAYDGIKKLVTDPFVRAVDVEYYIGGLVSAGSLSQEAGAHAIEMMHCVMDTDYLVDKMRNSRVQDDFLRALSRNNAEYGKREIVLGDAMDLTDRLIDQIRDTTHELRRYAEIYEV